MSQPGVGNLHAALAVLTALSPKPRNASQQVVRPNWSLSTFIDGKSRFKRRSRRLVDAAAWCPLQDPLLWQGSVTETKSGCDRFQQLSAPWKMMMLSDGSVTRHLQLMTGTDIIADCLDMQLVDPAQHSLAPSTVELLTGPLLRRQVLLRSSDSGCSPLVYAASWWNQDEGSRLLRNASVPVGAVLRSKRAEVFRDIQLVYFGHSEEYEELLGTSGPMWGREYVFWHDSRPLAIIHEVFSPRLDEYLGSSRSDRDLLRVGRTNGHSSNGASH